MRAGASPNADDGAGNTALHMAASADLGGHFVISRKTECMKELVSHGGDVNLKNSEGNTPLQIAINSSNLDCVAFLALEGGAVVDQNDPKHNLLHKVGG